MSEEQTPDAGVTPAAPATRHNSVEALEDRFGDALLRYETQAGDQQVVYLDSARSLEVLEWLKDAPDQKYDLLVDVTAVDYLSRSGRTLPAFPGRLGSPTRPAAAGPINRCE